MKKAGKLFECVEFLLGLRSNAPSQLLGSGEKFLRSASCLCFFTCLCW